MTEIETKWRVKTKGGRKKGSTCICANAYSIFKCTKHLRVGGKAERKRREKSDMEKEHKERKV